jgi:hypothetical protein
MAEHLTEAQFAEQLNTKFRVLIEAPRPVELELVEVKGWRSGTEEARGMERFSVLFKGPADILMPQNIYPLEHEQLGRFDIFLVPVGRDESSFNYEAVFNYFK